MLTNATPSRASLPGSSSRCSCWPAPGRSASRPGYAACATPRWPSDPLTHPRRGNLTRTWIQPLPDSSGVRRDVTRFAHGVRRTELAAAATWLGRFDGPARLVCGTRDRRFTSNSAVGWRPPPRTAKSTRSLTPPRSCPSTAQTRWSAPYTMCWPAPEMRQARRDRDVGLARPLRRSAAARWPRWPLTRAEETQRSPPPATRTTRGAQRCKSCCRTARRRYRRPVTPSCTIEATTRSSSGSSQTDRPAERSGRGSRRRALTSPEPVPWAG